MYPTFTETRMHSSLVQSPNGIIRRTNGVKLRLCPPNSRGSHPMQISHPGVATKVEVSTRVQLRHMWLSLSFTSGVRDRRYSTDGGYQTIQVRLRQYAGATI